MDEFIVPEEARKRQIKKKGKKKNKELNLILFALLIITTLALVTFKIFTPKTDEYELNFFEYANVTKRNFLETLNIQGTIQPQKVTRVISPLNGEVLHVYAKEGQDVSKGDTLISLYSLEVLKDKEGANKNIKKILEEAKQFEENYLYDLDRNKEKLKDAQDEKARAEINLLLQKELFDLGVISPMEYDYALNKLTGSERNIKLVEKDMEQAKIDYERNLNYGKENLSFYEEVLKTAQSKIEKFEVLAPISGRILSIYNEKEGKLIFENNLLVELANLREQEVLAKVNPSDAEKLNIEAQVKIDDGINEYPGVITYISSQAEKDDKGTWVNIRAKVLQASENIRPNSNVSLSIAVKEYNDSLSLPRGAYLTSGRQLIVYVIEGDKAIRKEVKFGILSGNNVQILNGLSLGDKVITSSYDSFRHLEEIKIKDGGGLVND